MRQASTIDTKVQLCSQLKWRTLKPGPVKVNAAGRITYRAEGRDGDRRGREIRTRSRERKTCKDER